MEEGGSQFCNVKEQGTMNWRDRWLEKMFNIINKEIRIKRIASNKIRDIWHKVGQYLIK
jgi:phage terminase large subunit